jgi:hypothetical protein
LKPSPASFRTCIHKLLTEGGEDALLEVAQASASLIVLLLAGEVKLISLKFCKRRRSLFRPRQKLVGPLTRLVIRSVFLLVEAQAAWVQNHVTFCLQLILAVDCERPGI